MKSGVSLQQMLTEVKRQSESKEDYLIAPNRLRMESYGKEMFLHLSDDSIASILTSGLIGDKYVSISRGGSDHILAPGDSITETESAVDLGSLIGKYAFGGVK